MKYFKILKTIMRVSLVREMEHRLHFSLSTFGSILGTLLTFVVPLIIVKQSGYLGGKWDQDSMVILLSIFAVVNGIDSSLFHSLNMLPARIAIGQLDSALRTPLNGQFAASIEFFNWDFVPSVFIGIFGVLYGINRASLSIDLFMILGLILAVIAGSVVFYSLHFLTMVLGFWFMNADNLAALFHVFRRSSSYPTETYGKFVSIAFTFFIPLAFVAAVPSRVVIDHSLFLTFITIAVAVLLFLITTLAWKQAFRQYTSASS